ncbi:hypothetical protein [Mesorhizobium sp. CN2-181]|uniref:hypothetical protein n=1 Tax=Mesorhizobium yinganensis TaxID=3157707 RepID=UPI0032B88101
MSNQSPWRPMDFGDLERRLLEARDLLAQAARMIAVQEMEKVSSIADMHLEEEKQRDEHSHRRRYR